MTDVKLTQTQAQYIWDVLADIWGRKHGVKLTVTVTQRRENERAM